MVSNNGIFDNQLHSRENTMKNDIKIAVAMAEIPLKQIIKEQKETIEALRLGIRIYKKQVSKLKDELSDARDEVKSLTLENRELIFSIKEQ